jgi:hypothetical protein
MNDQELVKWSDRVRSMFRGEMDEVLFTLARSRIAALSFASAWAALDDYAIAHGGAKSRFIPGKFLEFYAAQRKIDGPRLEAIKRQTEQDQKERDRIYWSDATNRDRDEQLALIAGASPARIDAAVGYLQSLGWDGLRGEPSTWSKARLLAVTDILRGASLRGYDRESCRWSLEMSPEEFWRRAGKPPESLDRAPALAAAPTAPRAPEALSVDPAAFEAYYRRETAAALADGIPF